MRRFAGVRFVFAVLLPLFLLLSWLASGRGRLYTESARHGILSLELAGSAPRAQTLLNEWAASGDRYSLLDVARNAIGWDFAFIVVYATGLFLVCTWLANRAKGRLRTAGYLAAWAAPLAGLFDCLENLSMLRMIDGDLSWAAIGAGCATVKFALLALALIWVLVASAERLLPKPAASPIAMNAGNGAPAAVPYNTAADLPPCDIVMKGGITSGIVYPKAALALSFKYRFANLGGASAGAIAAAVTAAAEYSRQQGKAGFVQLEKLPAWLGKGDNLFSLFRPDAGTRPLFDVFTAFLGRDVFFVKLGRALHAAVKQMPGFALAGLLPGLTLGALACLDPIGHATPAIAAALLLSLLAVPLALIIGLALGLLHALPANGFGICSGLAEEPDGNPPLTPWLADVIDKIARGAEIDDPKTRLSGPPLTLGDLWCADLPEPRDPESTKARFHKPELRRVNLVAMTTSLTHGRPYRLPFDTNVFYFDEDELRLVFPERVVHWMIEHARKEDDPVLAAKLPPKLHPLPLAGDLPLVFCARLSLSFPFLLSAVPLHAIDFSLARCREKIGAPLWERCWFSDGGISSNFPIHFFDKPLPSWPTFGLDLGPFHPCYPRSETDQSKNVWLPTANPEGISERWNRFEPQGMPGFIGALVDAVQAFMDNMLARVPGFRDRIAHVSLDAQEGGLNLAMPPQVISALTDRGWFAGQAIVDRFALSGSLGWDNHRWVRYRSFLSLLEPAVKAFAKALDPASPSGKAYRALMDRPPSYKWASDEQKEYAGEVTTDLQALAAKWANRAGKTPVDLEVGAPRPTPDLRVVPKV